MTYEIAVETESFEPVARLYGEPLGEIPSDLFIPPDALRIILEAFEGPLDLLLYLIRKHNLDVLDIPMAQLTAQYMAYVEMMRTHQLELAAEYLLMAALLIEIKSRMLLPRPVQAESEEQDPRAELVRRLLEYEQMKKAARRLDELPQLGRDYSDVAVWLEADVAERLPDVNPEDLRNAWFDAPDLAGQQAICRDLQVQAMKVLPSVPVGQYIQPTAYRTNVSGVSRGFPVFWGVKKT